MAFQLSIKIKKDLIKLNPIGSTIMIGNPGTNTQKAFTVMKTVPVEYNNQEYVELILEEKGTSAHVSEAELRLIDEINKLSELG